MIAYARTHARWCDAEKKRTQTTVVQPEIDQQYILSVANEKKKRKREMHFDFHLDKALNTGFRWLKVGVYKKYTNFT